MKPIAALLAAMVTGFTLAGCAAQPPARPVAVSPCAVSEASYECQVERYHNVNMP